MAHSASNVSRDIRKLGQKLRYISEEVFSDSHRVSHPAHTYELGSFLCGAGYENLASMKIFNELVVRSETPVNHKEDEEQKTEIVNPSQGLNNLLGM